MAHLTPAPFARSNGKVSRPLFCACTRSRVGAYSTHPMCSSDRSLRSARDTVQYGPELYDGYYGQAFKLRFPNYTGAVYQATIPAAGSSTLQKHGPMLMVGDSHNPYFRLYNVAPRGTVPSDTSPQ